MRSVELDAHDQRLACLLAGLRVQRKPVLCATYVFALCLIASGLFCFLSPFLPVSFIQVFHFHCVQGDSDDGCFSFLIFPILLWDVSFSATTCATPAAFVCPTDSVAKANPSELICYSPSGCTESDCCYFRTCPLMFRSLSVSLFPSLGPISHSN